jgi:F0F1-type ATP synthase membrane subunit b/b'
MIKSPKKPEEGTTGTEEIQPKIMTKPLPAILDELEDYIKRVEEAVKQAQAAARDSRQAAGQAREAGEKAADAARKAAEAAVCQVRDEAARAIEALNNRISEVSEQLDSLIDKVKHEVIALDEAFLALKDKHVEDSPFFQR